MRADWLTSVKEKARCKDNPEVSHLGEKESSYAIKRNKKIKSKKSSITNILTFLCWYVNKIYSLYFSITNLNFQVRIHPL